MRRVRIRVSFILDNIGFFSRSFVFILACGSRKSVCGYVCIFIIFACYTFNFKATWWLRIEVRNGYFFERKRICIREERKIKCQLKQLFVKNIFVWIKMYRFFVLDRTTTTIIQKGKHWIYERNQQPKQTQTKFISLNN